jgi:crotonobetainyl-CoA:carnitine CoA-transferase CaiB-like acyl-CoA transferase
MMSEALQKHSSEYWIKRLDEANIPAGPINKISDLEDDPQLEAREMVVNMPDEQVGEYRMAGNPVKLSESPVQYRLPPPKLGQHTVEVLTHELNLSAERLKMLHEKEII